MCRTHYDIFSVRKAKPDKMKVCRVRKNASLQVKNPLEFLGDYG